jgi:hypothetical protein
MKRVELIPINHSVKIGDAPAERTPNLTEDTLFIEDGIVIGFYLRDVAKYSKKLNDYLAIANSEFRSKRVPKAVLSRSTAINARREGGKGVEQYSTILGSVPPKPHMRRAYPTMSSVHGVKSAEIFVKAMYLTCLESELLIHKIAPNIYDRQKEIISTQVDEKWRFGNLFTSSISNFNISAPVHIDNANIRECVNVILTKRSDSKGGNLYLPDYDITIDNCDNSIIVYPAWKSLHGVTPIVPMNDKGYRNSLIFYPLRAFANG